MNNVADRLVRRWLLLSAIAVVVAVAVGGVTRLTESGLSITEWQPVSGLLPPTSAVAWDQAYQRYLTIPEAQGVHRGITLEQFRLLYWWEWVHRLIARLVGLLLAVPYFVFLARGALRRRHRWRLLLLPILAAAQGALGWYMVKSGLTMRPTVSAYRLTAHLGMALAIYAICLWTILDLGPQRRGTTGTPIWLSRGILVTPWLTAVTLLSGGFVAGLDAGLIYNTFPLMGGRVVPPWYYVPALGLRNPFENPVAAQFDHRLLAIATATLLLVLAAAGRRPGVPVPVRRATTIAGMVILLQVGLGITTLLLRVPLILGVLHQVTGVMVLTAVVVAAHRCRPRVASHD